MIPQGERRLLDSLNASRGYHELLIRYKEDWPRCIYCGQSIRTDYDLAYQLFITADLWWDGKAITHNALRSVLMENEQFEERSSGKIFRQPDNYGLCPFREWCRRELGKTGVVIADIDNGLRRYGPRFNLDSNGDAMLIEKKEKWPTETNRPQN